MIRLDVQDYCQECQMFKADVDKMPARINSGRIFDTVIRCKRADACREIHKMFEKQNDKCQGFMGPTF